MAVPEAPFHEDAVAYELDVAPQDLVWIKGVLEGYDGLAAIWGDGSGLVRLYAHATQAHELEALLQDLSAGAALRWRQVAGPPRGVSPG